MSKPRLNSHRDKLVFSEKFSCQFSFISVKSISYLKEKFQYFLFAGVQDGHFQTFPNTPFSWGQSPFSTRMIPSSTRATVQQSTFKSQLSITATDIATATVILIPMSRPSYHGATLNVTTSVVPESSGIPSKSFSPTSVISSPTLHRPHATMSSTKGLYLNECHVELNDL